MERLSVGTLLLLLGALACYGDFGDHEVLDSVLEEYDTLHTDHITHTITANPHTRRIQFSVLGRYFELHLRPSQRFTDDFGAYSENVNGELKRLHIDTSQFYEGHLHEEEGSLVSAHVSTNGVVSAVITTSTDSYHIEPSSRYIDRPHPFHMVAYRASSVRDRLGSARMDYTLAPTIPEPDLYMEKSHSGSVLNQFDSERLKRQMMDRLTGNSCPMILVADYTMVRLLRDSESVATFMTQLVLAVDSEIYRQTNWVLNSDGSTQNNTGLSIRTVMIHETPNLTNPEHYNVASDIEAGVYLGRVRLFDWSNYCLAHFFMDRRFESGLLGLANIASPSPSQTGGICSRRFRDSTLPGSPFVIYNTGLTTVRNRGQLMVMSELLRVTGHEVGHNWGAHHDPADCAGFLMNEFAQDGSQPSHSLFSLCSRTSIGQVLLSKSGRCFTTQDLQTSTCGNFRVEPNEDCDVGQTNSDPCCFSNCTFTPSSVCSDRNSVCCSSCQVAPDTQVCRIEKNVSLDCVTNSFCNGMNTFCPASPSAPDGAPCINGVCSNSSCQDLCDSRGMTRCYCTSEVDECSTCCNSTGDCLPLTPRVVLGDGAPCSLGVCIEGVCTRVTQDQIARIWQIIVTLDVDAFGLFLRENIVGCVLFFAVLLWCPVSILIHFCLDQKLWHKFQNGRDHADWFKQREKDYNAAMNQAVSREHSEPLVDVSEKKPLLTISVEEPVDDTPAPTW